MRRPTFSKAQRLAIAERDGWVCNTEHGDGCGEPIERYSAWQIDHIVSWELTHNDSPENLQLLCWDCHRVKTHERDRPMINKSTRQRTKDEDHRRAMKLGERRLSKQAKRRARITANAPKPLAERQSIPEIDG